MKDVIIAFICILFLPVIIAGFCIGFAGRWAYESILKGWQAWDEMMEEP